MKKLILAFLGLTAALMACQDTTPPAQVASIYMACTVARLAVTETSTCSAKVYDAIGTLLSPSTLAFNSNDPTTASVSSAGLVTGLAAGETIIYASSGKINSNLIPFTVFKPEGPLSSITLTCFDVYLQSTNPCAATGFDASGTMLSIQPTFIFSSSDTTKASVSSSGVVSGISLGATTITATTGAFSASSSLNVIAPGSKKYVKIAAGESHALALKSDGTVVTWGDQTNGTMSVPGGLSGVTDIAAGDLYSLVLKADGKLMAWAFKNAGTNPDGLAIPAKLTDVKAIAVGFTHALALKHDGTVIAWAYSNYAPYANHGQTAVPKGLSGVVAIAAGERQSFALKSDGTVVAWGDNTNGQISGAAGLTAIQAIASGGLSAIALKQDGTLIAWGGNLSVPANLTGVVGISVGSLHALALKQGATVTAFGYAFAGETTVPSNLSTVTAVAAGDGFSLALKTDGTIAAWGANNLGQTTLP